MRIDKRIFQIIEKYFDWAGDEGIHETSAERAFWSIIPPIFIYGCCWTVVILFGMWVTGYI